MADIRLSERGSTSTVTGGYIHIITPDGVGGYESYRISVTNLLADIQSQIDALSSGIIKEAESNKSSNFTFILPTNSKIEAIDYRAVSGTTTVTCGTTPGGTDIHTSRSVTTSTDINNYVGKSFSSAKTLYFTVSGGTINTLIWYRENIF